MIYLEFRVALYGLGDDETPLQIRERLTAAVRAAFPNAGDEQVEVDITSHPGGHVPDYCGLGLEHQHGAS